MIKQLKTVDWNITFGELSIIYGDNGAGKSKLLQGVFNHFYFQNFNKNLYRPIQCELVHNVKRVIYLDSHNSLRLSNKEDSFFKEGIVRFSLSDCPFISQNTLKNITNDTILWDNNFLSRGERKVLHILSVLQFYARCHDVILIDDIEDGLSDKLTSYLMREIVFFMSDFPFQVIVSTRSEAIKRAFRNNVIDLSNNGDNKNDTR